MKVSFNSVFCFLMLKATYNHPKGFMIGGVDGSQLMRLLMQLVNARKVIEIGKVNLT